MRQAMGTRDDRLPPGAVTTKSVTVRVLPDGKVATRTRFSVVRAGGHRWAVCGTNYNPVEGRFNAFKHVVFMSRVRTKRQAAILCRMHFPERWNWYLTDPESVRRKAKEAGIRVRFVNCAKKGGKTT